MTDKGMRRPFAEIDKDTSAVSPSTDNDNRESIVGQFFPSLVNMQ